jgi:predicted O-methyltransferase YrrM
MIVAPAVKAYLEALHAPQDDWLKGMREQGARDDVPIVHAETGAFLELITRATNARHVVEVGTAIGVSTLHLARGGAHVTSFEIDPARHTAAAAFLAGYTVDLRLEDATEGLKRLEPRRFDIAFIDGPKQGYADHVDLCLDLLRPGGLLIVDNALMSGAVATQEPTGPWGPEHIAALRALNDRVLSLGGVVLPIGDGVGMVVRR